MKRTNCPEFPPYRRRNAAFTIVEVGIAAGVLALVITTSITVMQRAFLSLDTARNITTASQILQTELEKLRLKDWATVSAYPAGPTTLTVSSSFTSVSSIGNRFSLTRTVSDVRADLKLITFTVRWTSYDRHAVSRTYFTYYGQNGMYDYYYNTT